MPHLPHCVPGCLLSCPHACLQENFQAVIGTLQGFKYEPRAPDEETYVAQK